MRQTGVHKIRKIAHFRANIMIQDVGNARIAGMADDLKLSSTQYEWLLWAFYITYIAFEWMTLMCVLDSCFILTSLTCIGTV
jgi:hypothetical protein